MVQKWETLDSGLSSGMRFFDNSRPWLHQESDPLSIGVTAQRLDYWVG